MNTYNNKRNTRTKQKKIQRKIYQLWLLTFEQEFVKLFVDLQNILSTETYLATGQWLVK
jgi:hypothetical protein